jgi:DNA-binding MarR family transcriptional regulator
MKKNIGEKVAEALFNILPIVHKKLVGSLSSGLETNLSHYHLSILGILNRTESLSISEIGKRLLISKPQMTAILDRLISLGLIERIPGLVDRRIINISITKKGTQELLKAETQIKANFKMKLAGLDQTDLELLSKSIENLNIVAAKIK